jgi:hypothetical protein
MLMAKLQARFASDAADSEIDNLIELGTPTGGRLLEAGSTLKSPMPLAALLVKKPAKRRGR